MKIQRLVVALTALNVVLLLLTAAQAASTSGKAVTPGLWLADETTQSGVQIIARQSGSPDRPTTTSITLTGKNGQRRIVAP